MCAPCTSSFPGENGGARGAAMCLVLLAVLLYRMPPADPSRRWSGGVMRPAADCVAGGMTSARSEQFGVGAEYSNHAHRRMNRYRASYIYGYVRYGKEATSATIAVRRNGGQ